MLKKYITESNTTTVYFYNQYLDYYKHFNLNDFGMVILQQFIYIARPPIYQLYIYI